MQQYKWIYTWMTLKLLQFYLFEKRKDLKSEDARYQEMKSYQTDPCNAKIMQKKEKKKWSKIIFVKSWERISKN